ncbi:MAG: B12-binding domain-containing radical SAM protein [Candidatus Coatesbacteria bacterium]|nr:B12-binding domain-containing radical SAM protein [Candidatus Coatesbacteria bacterium]
MTTRKEPYFKKLLDEEIFLHKYEKRQKADICLVFPASYSVAMSSLGYIAVHDKLMQEGLHTDRAFIDEKLGLYAIESRRLISTYRFLFVSLYLEEHLLYFIEMLRKLNIEPLSEKRESHFILAGGPLVDLLPGIISRIADGIYKGPLTDEGIDAIRGFCKNPKKNFDFENCNGSNKVDACGNVITPNSHFPEKFLIEIQKGCPHGCKFCSASRSSLGFIDRDFYLLNVKHARKFTDKIGLVGLALHTHPLWKELLKETVELGYSIGTSSLRFDMLDNDILDLLKKGKMKTVSTGLETGSRKLLEMTGKGFNSEDFLSFAERLKKTNMESLKLYLIIGLPLETEADIIETAELMNSFNSIYKGRIEISINPMVPKRNSVWKDASFIERRDYRKRIDILKTNIKNKRISFNIESYRSSQVMYLLNKMQDNELEDLCYDKAFFRKKEGKYG